MSYGALGAPIIALATVTAGTLGLTVPELLPIYSASVGKIVAILALLPPWILLYLVSGSKGMWSAWPLAIVGSLGYIAGQLPTAVYLGPYLPDVDRRDRVLRRAAAAAQGLAAGAGPRPMAASPPPATRRRRRMD